MEHRRKVRRKTLLISLEANLYKKRADLSGRLVGYPWLSKDFAEPLGHFVLG